MTSSIERTFVLSESQIKLGEQLTELKKLEPLIKSIDLSSVPESKRKNVQMLSSMASHFMQTFAADFQENEQVITTHFFKAIFSAAADCQNLFSEEDTRAIGDFVKDFTVSATTDVIEEKEQNLAEMLHRVIAAQERVKPLLPSFSCEEGNSKGVLYSIKKKGELRGWVYATMHDLYTPELQKAACLVQGVYQRLHQCNILGTEVRFNLASPVESVENHLLAFAQRYGIYNLGLDAKERDDGIDFNALAKEYFWRDIEVDVSLLPSDVKEEYIKLKEIKEKNIQFLYKIAQPYREGNSQEIRRVFETEMDETALACFKNKHEEKRQKKMICNIDACLKALEQTFSSSKLKGFFAIGTMHVLGDKIYSPTVVEGLIQRGWEVEWDKF